METQERFTLEPAGGLGPIRGVIDLPSRPGPRPTVIISHGFKGFFEWGFFPPLAELLRERGMAVIRFNFSGTGMAPGDELVTDLDAFRRNTFSRERDELLAVLAAAGDTIGSGRVDRDHLALFGHSRGGAGSLLAATHPSTPDLRALVTWSAVSTFERFGQVPPEIWRQQGYLPIANARTGQELQLGVELLDDLENNREALDLLAAAGRCPIPWLIVHGEDDETVPVAEAQALAERVDGPHELLAIAGANHTFGARHPFVGPTPELIRALNATQLWLRRYLGS